VSDFVTGDLANAASAIGGEIGCYFGVCSHRAPPPPPPTELEKYYSRNQLIDSLAPTAKYAYLMTHDNWDRGYISGGFTGEIAKVSEYKAFILEFADMVNKANYLKAIRENQRRIFLDLLSSNPSEAIALSNAGFLDPTVDQSQSELLMKFGGLGFDSTYKNIAAEVKAEAVRFNVGIDMEDGRMTFRDAKQ
jgi:hypothetical protein